MAFEEYVDEFTGTGLGFTEPWLSILQVSGQGSALVLDSLCLPHLPNPELPFASTQLSPSTSFHSSLSHLHLQPHSAIHIQHVLTHPPIDTVFNTQYIRTKAMSAAEVAPATAVTESVVKHEDVSARFAAFTRLISDPFLEGSKFTPINEAGVGVSSECDDLGADFQRL